MKKNKRKRKERKRKKRERKIKEREIFPAVSSFHRQWIMGFDRKELPKQSLLQSNWLQRKAADNRRKGGFSAKFHLVTINEPVQDS